MSLQKLSNELLMIITESLEYQSDINALSQANRRLNAVASPQLYQRLVGKTIWESGLNQAMVWAAQNDNGPSLRRLLQICDSLEPPREPPLMPISQAAAAGSIEAVKILLEHGVNPNPNNIGRQIGFGTSPILAAIGGGHESVTRIFINAGAHLEYPSEISLQQLLHLAVYAGNVSITKLLLESGCDPNTLNHMEDHPLRAACAVDVSIARILIEAGARYDMSPGLLQTACSYANPPLVKLLLEIGAKFEYREDCCRLFARIASPDPSRAETAQIILEHIDIDQEIRSDEKFYYLMEGAAAGGFQNLMKRLLNHMESPEYFGNVDFLDKGFQIAVSHGQIAILELLIAHGGIPNHSAESLLQCAVNNSQAEALTFLIDRGLELPLERDDDELALDFIMSQLIGLGDVELIKSVLKAGMAFDDSQDSEFPSLIEAARQGDAMFDLLLQNGIKLDHRKKSHHVALAEAARGARVNTLKEFLDAGFDVDTQAPDELRWNPTLLTMAATSDNRETAEAAVDFLLSRGANIDALQPEDPMTPLMLVCLGIGPDDDKLRDYTIRSLILGIQLLLDKGANLLLMTDTGKSALTVAADDGDHRIMEALLTYVKEKKLPFELIKGQLSIAMSIGNSEVAQMISCYYWPRVYPAE